MRAHSIFFLRKFKGRAYNTSAFPGFIINGKNPGARIFQKAKILQGIPRKGGIFLP
jgi:hypothetical protein